MQLYASCYSQSACASGQCDFNGNCVGACTTSNPARIGTKCACPSGYFDDGVNANCVPSFSTASSNFTQLVSLTGYCTQHSQSAYIPSDPTSLLVTCVGSGTLYAVSTANSKIT